MKADTPKSLGDPVIQTARRGRLYDAHVAPLTRYVERLRARVGSTAAIPYFDPWDGGVNAEVLFLLNQDAGIARERTVSWNVVPWYIGTGTRIRPANRTDIAQGIGPLAELLPLLPALRAVVLVGQKAGTARRAIAELLPQVRIFDTPHPSPLFINNKPENRGRLLVTLKDVASFLGDRRPGV